MVPNWKNDVSTADTQKSLLKAVLTHRLEGAGRSTRGAQRGGTGNATQSAGRQAREGSDGHEGAAVEHGVQARASCARARARRSAVAGALCSRTGRLHLASLQGRRHHGHPALFLSL
eukprot:1347823-Rhodomonas_salina.2